jgi:hypothetical protein
MQLLRRVGVEDEYQRKEIEPACRNDDAVDAKWRDYRRLGLMGRKNDDQRASASNGSTASPLVAEGVISFRPYEGRFRLRKGP